MAKTKTAGYIYILNAVIAVACFVGIILVVDTQLQILLATASLFNQIAVAKHEIVLDIRQGD